MSKYTTEVRFICEQVSGLDESVGYNDVNSVIATARPKIFDFSYPIFDTAYKPTLESKILKHYYTREIGMETYGLWKQKLDSRLNDIMPYYNQLYESALIKYDPLNTFMRHEVTHRDDVTKVNGDIVNGGKDTRVKDGSDTYTHTTGDDKWTLYSDTPQGGIDGILATEADPSLATHGYLTNATHYLSGDEDGYEGVTDYDSTITDNYGRTVKETRDVDGDTDIVTDAYGYYGKNPSLSILDLRKTFLNIDLMIIEELADLFFQLW